MPSRVRRGSSRVRPDGRSRRPDRRRHVGCCGRMGPIRDGDDDRCSPAPSGHRRGRRQARRRRHARGRRDAVRWRRLARRPHGVQRLQVARWPRRSGDRGARPRCHRPDTAAAGVDGRSLPLRVRRHSDRSGRRCPAVHAVHDVLPLGGRLDARRWITSWRSAWTGSNNTRRGLRDLLLVPSRAVAGGLSVRAGPRGRVTHRLAGTSGRSQPTSDAAAKSGDRLQPRGGRLRVLLAPYNDEDSHQPPFGVLAPK